MTSPLGRPARERVRVTGPPRRRTPRPRSGDIDAETRLGGMYMASLVREQLRLARRTLVLLLGTVAALPALFALAPEVGEARLLGVPLPWLLPGVLVYPWLVLLGWRHVRRAERIEHDFAELIGGGER